jgi:hypothetical protein
MGLFPLSGTVGTYFLYLRRLGVCLRSAESQSFDGGDGEVRYSRVLVEGAITG